MKKCLHQYDDLNYVCIYEFSKNKISRDSQNLIIFSISGFVFVGTLHVIKCGSASGAFSVQVQVPCSSPRQQQRKLTRGAPI